jgi:hypothetical protein
MRKIATGLVGVLVLLACGRAYGMATEQIGPDSVIGHPTFPQPDWPKGIVEIPRHESRVYSIWVNGNETFYFKATPEDVNPLVALFSKARMRDHEVVIATSPKPVKTFTDLTVDYNVSLQIVAGIALFAAREGLSTSDLPLEPRLTIYPGDDRSLLEQVIWPKNLIITSEIPDLPLPTGRTRPQRELHYGRLKFADGSPTQEFVRGGNYRITLWEARAQDGINVGSVNNEGHFTVRLSAEERADLRAGKTWLTVSTGNFATESRRTDQRIPVDALVREKDRAQPVPVKGPDYYYGRLLFEDDTPAVLDRAAWRGAEIMVDFSYAGSATPDAEGYFKLVFTPEQFEKLCAAKPRKNVYIPNPLDVSRATATLTFPANLLSQDKAKAGVVKVPRLPAPKQDLPTAESRRGKPIPGFELIRFETFQLEQAKGKPLLICFWDAQQRSSRQCLQSLENEKDALQAKGLVVLAIHAGTQPAEQVRTWLRENGISLPVGTITGDSHDVLLTWGAKGSPWLVLTDEQHIVAKEGFGLDEFLTGK